MPMSASQQRLFAVIPAAGRSRRMGRPKLLLPLGETTVIGRLIRTLNAAGLDAALVLVRPDDEPLADEVSRHDAQLVRADRTPDEMRTSVELLLDAVSSHLAPTDDDGWLLVPGDHPFVRPGTLERLRDAWRARPGSVVVPVHEGRRGHPAIFPWSQAARVRSLPPGVGVNHLLRDAADVVEVPVEDVATVLDLDTPDDYKRALTLLQAE